MRIMTLATLAISLFITPDHLLAQCGCFGHGSGVYGHGGYGNPIGGTGYLYSAYTNYSPFRFYSNSQFIPQMLPPVPQKRRVVSLLIALTLDKDIGNSCAVDLGNMQQLMYNGIGPQYRGPIITLSGNDVTPTRVSDTIRGLGIGRGDTLVVYYSGHGGFGPPPSPDDVSGGHFIMASTGEQMLRKPLWDDLASKNAHLTVLITDCCNVAAPPEAAFSLYTKKFRTPAAANGVLYSLLLNSHGSVDINSAERGEFAFGDNVNGGVFTSAMKDVLNDPTRFSLPQYTTWTTFYKKLEVETSNKYRYEFRPSNRRTDPVTDAQVDQKPVAFRLYADID